MSIIASVLLVSSFAPAHAVTGDGGKTITRGQDRDADKSGRTVTRQGGQRAKPAQNDGDKKKKKGPKFVGPFAKDQYPLQERLRPLVLPSGMVEAELDVGAVGTADTTGAAVGLRGAVGIGDVLELGVGTGLNVAPDFSWNNAINLEVHALAVDGKVFDFAPGLSVPIVIQDGAPFTFALDATSRAVVGKKVFLYFGNDAIPVTITPDVGLGIAANGGLGFQLSKRTVLTLDTSLATLTVLPDVGVTGVWETFVGNAALQVSPGRRSDVGLRATVTNGWSGDVGLTNWGAQAFVAGRF